MRIFLRNGAQLTSRPTQFVSVGINRKLENVTLIDVHVDKFSHLKRSLASREGFFIPCQKMTAPGRRPEASSKQLLNGVSCRKAKQWLSCYEAHQSIKRRQTSVMISTSLSMGVNKHSSGDMKNINNYPSSSKMMKGSSSKKVGIGEVGATPIDPWWRLQA